MRKPYSKDRATYTTRCKHPHDAQYPINTNNTNNASQTYNKDTLKPIQKTLVTRTMENAHGAMQLMIKYTKTQTHTQIHT